MTEAVKEKLSVAVRKAAKKRIENGTHNFLGGEISRKTNRKRIEEGTHNFLDGEFQRNVQRKRVESGTHPFLGENNPVHKRVEDGTHHLLGGEIQKKTNRKRIEEGTHHLLGENNPSHKRVENGSHHFQVKGMIPALNQETGEVHRISSELYHSRRDIYFTTQSKVFKEWKKQQEEITHGQPIFQILGVDTFN